MLLRPDEFEKPSDWKRQDTLLCCAQGRSHWDHKPREGVSIDKLMKRGRVWTLLSKEVKQEVTEMGKGPGQANGELMLVRAWCRQEGQKTMVSSAPLRWESPCSPGLLSEILQSGNEIYRWATLAVTD